MGVSFVSARAQFFSRYSTLGGKAPKWTDGRPIVGEIGRWMFLLLGSPDILMIFFPTSHICPASRGPGVLMLKPL